MTVLGQVACATAIVADINDKQVIFKNCTPLFECIRKSK